MHVVGRERERIEFEKDFIFHNFSHNFFNKTKPKNYVNNKIKVTHLKAIHKKKDNHKQQNLKKQTKNGGE